jgi:hypothetical protein
MEEGGGGGGGGKGGRIGFGYERESRREEGSDDGRERRKEGL